MADKPAPGKFSFLITGGAGFIGSALAEHLSENAAYRVVIMDDLSTGSLKNIAHIKDRPNVVFHKMDIRDREACLDACEGIDIVLHHAALGSIPRSIDDPVNTNSVNVTGFLNMLDAARKKNVKRFVYASSSSVYGDDKRMPKEEAHTGKPLSPYAVTKCANELYAEVFSKTYGMEIIGLRYFNVFGPRQNVNGPYAAVIPIFIRQMMKGEPCTIFGDGKNTRDFTFVNNVVSAVVKTALTENKEAPGKVYNIACGFSISVLDVYNRIAALMNIPEPPHFAPSRTGDIAGSLASINKATEFLGYAPVMSVEDGLEKTVEWYKSNKSWIFPEQE
jgi:UDP-N-acetylglucosamine 4-epimerase